MEHEPERILRLWSNTRYFQGELKRAGFNIGGVNTPATETPITPIIVGDGRAAMDFSRALFDEGVMATGIAFPTVPEGKARIRAILTSEHTRAQLDRALETLERVAKRMGVLGAGGVSAQEAFAFLQNQIRGRIGLVGTVRKKPG